MNHVLNWAPTNGGVCFCRSVGRSAGRSVTTFLRIRPGCMPATPTLRAGFAGMNVIIQKSATEHVRYEKRAREAEPPKGGSALRIFKEWMPKYFLTICLASQNIDQTQQSFQLFPQSFWPQNLDRAKQFFFKILPISPIFFVSFTVRNIGSGKCF